MTKISYLFSLFSVSILLVGCPGGDDMTPTEIEGDEAGECSDGADNDQDDAFDCDDSGCNGSPDCEWGPEDCIDEYLGTSTGEGIAVGTITEADNDFDCARFSAAGDVEYFWTAPEDGTFQFDTGGSDDLTALALLKGDCTGEILDCTDQCGDGWLQPGYACIWYPVHAGETYVVVVDGDEEYIWYQLNIDLKPEDEE